MDLNLNLNVNVRFLFDTPATDSATIGAITFLGKNIMSALQALAASVALNTTVTESAIALIDGLHDKLEAAILAATEAGGNMAAVQALSDSLALETGRLSEAVASNTIADPAPVPADPVPADPVPADPVADPVTDQPVVDPVADPVVEPIADPVVEPITDLAPISTGDIPDPQAGDEQVS